MKSQAILTPGGHITWVLNSWKVWHKTLADVAYQIDEEPERWYTEPADFAGLISFSMTTDEYESGIKTVTRRAWKDAYAARMTAGRLLYAWSALPFVKSRNPRRLNPPLIRITQDAYRERIADIGPDDLLAEGDFARTPAQFAAFVGKPLDTELWVVRFETVLDPCGVIGD
jgi:hypothetical protein